MAQMRALQLVRPQVLEVREVPVPEIGPGEALVKVAGAGLCHSDVHVRHAPQFPVAGLTLGHETAGHVAAVGRDVSGVGEGDAVLVYLVWACGRCRACREGRDNVCIEAGGRNAPPPCPGLGPDGGMADYIRVPARYLMALDGLDPVTAAPLADAGLTPMHAINGARHRLTPGATAVVIGVGGLGHAAVQILAATTGVRIVAVDTDHSKLDLATAQGAHDTLLVGEDTAEAVLGLTDGYGADAVFDFVGVQPTVDLAAQVIAPDGALRFVGVGGGRLQYSTFPGGSVPWGVDIRMSYGGTRRDQGDVLDLARSGHLALEVQRYALDDGVQAFDDLEAGKVLGRAVLVP